MSTTRTPNVCSSFSGACNDPVQFQNLPGGGCTISQNGTNTFPFSPATQGANGYYIDLPSPSTITIKAGLTAGQSYSYSVSGCANLVLKTVTIT